MEGFCGRGSQRPLELKALQWSPSPVWIRCPPTNTYGSALSKRRLKHVMQSMIGLVPRYLGHSLLLAVDVCRLGFNGAEPLNSGGISKVNQKYILDSNCISYYILRDSECI